MFRTFISILVMLCLFSCASTKQQQQNDAEEAARKIKTAKINAQLGIAYLERNNIQRAKKKLLIALDQAPHIAEPWYSMAYFLEATGNREQAQTHYLKAIEVSHGRGDAQNNYGTYLCRSGQYHAAIARFLLAVKDPDYLDSAAAYENAGLCALKIPNYRLAHQFFDQAVIQDPNRPVSLLELADLNYRKGNFDLAKAKLQQFTALSPPTQQAINLYARIEKKLAEQKSIDKMNYLSMQSRKKSLADKKKATSHVAEIHHPHQETNKNKNKTMIVVNKKKKNERHSKLAQVRYIRYM